MDNTVKLMAVILIILALVVGLISLFNPNDPAGEGSSAPPVNYTPATGYSATATALAQSRPANADGNTGAIQIDDSFQDDFSMIDPRWQLYEDETGSIQILDGKMVVTATGVTPVTAFLNGGEHKDVFLSIEGKLAGGSADNAWGLLCRASSPLDYYFALASSDGYAALGKNVAGAIEYIGASGYIPVDGMRADAPNEIVLQCFGPTISLIVNGSPVIEAVDYSMSEGVAGIAVSSLDGIATRLEMDDFVFGRME